MVKRPPISAIVLCGGRSSRMGQDKASLPFGDETLLDRVLRLVATVADDVVLAAAPAQPVPAGVRVSRDATTGVGPLPALSRPSTSQRAALSSWPATFRCSAGRLALLIDAERGLGRCGAAGRWPARADVRGVPDRRPAGTPRERFGRSAPPQPARLHRRGLRLRDVPRRAFSRRWTRSSRASRPAIRRRSIGGRWCSRAWTSTARRRAAV